MKRWRRRRAEGEEEFEEKELEEEVEEETRYLPPRRHFQDYFEDGDPGIPEEEWNRLETKIRAGKYVPKSSDPWTLHVLYNNLKGLGDL